MALADVGKMPGDQLDDLRRRVGEFWTAGGRVKNQSAAQVGGRIGELTALAELARNGLVANDITGQDYGLDAVVTVPARPLTDEQIRAISHKSVASWEMTATMVSVQIKNLRRPRLDASDLQLWSAANIRRPGSCFVIMVDGDHLVLLDPTSIHDLFKHCMSSGTASVKINYFSYPSFRIDARDGALGRYLGAWGHFGIQLTELSPYRDALATSGTICMDDAGHVVEQAMLINHLEDDDLQVWAEANPSRIVSEIDVLVRAVAPTCDDPNLVSEENKARLAESIISHNTYLGGPKEHKAFGRDNRSLPRLLPGEIEAFVSEYAAFFDRRVH